MTARFLWRDGRVVGQHELNHLGGPRSGDKIDFLADLARNTKGTLWERERERGEGPEVFSGWLVEVEPDCGRCAPPYGCPPGSHMFPIADLTGILAARERDHS